MQISFYHTLKDLGGSVIIPLEEGKPFPTDLKEAMKESGLDPAQLVKDFQASFKNKLSFYLPLQGQTTCIWLLGLGKDPSYQDIRLAFRSLAFQSRSSLGATVSVHFLNLDSKLSLDKWIAGATNGLALARYQIGLHKTGEEKDIPFLKNKLQLQVSIPAAETSTAQAAAEQALATADTQARIFDLVNAPANKKTPQILAEWAVQSGEKHGFDVQVHELEAIRELGMEALLAVNRGSEHPATFVVMEYNGPNASDKTVALVGKGVTFDTGGLSLKPSANMHFMKSDMGGAAAVLGTLELAARLKLPVRLLGFVPITDNVVDAHSVKPSDVIGSYSGKTIEIIDTDAEGRLILADALAYAVKNYKPDVLIDLATLTGSVIRTFGYECAGLFTNNDQLADQLTAAGSSSGENLWRLPIWEAYGNLMKSDVADIKNLSSKPIAGAITAAKFLQFFIDDHSNWAHLDIAGVAVQDSEFASQKNATAFGVHLLIDFLRQFK